MGLFSHDDGGRRFVMREKMLSIGDDFWIEDDGGNKAYKVNGKALRVRKTFILEDPDGNEVAHIQDRVVNVRGTMEIERDGETLATVHKALVGIRDRFDIDVEHGEDLKAKGNVLEHEYEVKRDGDVIATVSKKWVRVRETFGIEIAPGEDEPLLLSICVAIDELAR
ncbi:MAG: LURP-one-related family protein [Solirubrobacteraceae bacterium]